jgi:2,4-dienoyl-CoA reductase-like NADH-dependent reductase (Old Yellow Enzyme family)
MMADSTIADESVNISPLLEPLTIRGLTLSNRFAMAPMTRGFCPDGLPGSNVAAYYRRRAEGGVGLIFTEAIGSDHPAALGDTGLSEKDLPAFTGDDAVAAWRNVVDSVHGAGGRIVAQLWHQGPMRMPGSPPYPDVVAFAPSGRYGDKTKAADYYREQAEILDRPLPVPSDAEIVAVIESFARAAEQVSRAGFDGIAIHGAHGYLVDAFLWAETNRRSDRWGGDAVARTSFAAEIIKACRRAIGPDKPVFFRFSQWKQQDFRARLAETPQGLEAILGPLVDAGVDVLEPSTRYFNTPAFPGSDLSLAGWTKKLLGVHTGIVGGIGFNKGMYDTMTNRPMSGTNNLPLLLARFERGEFDVATVGRALLHDPHWVAKAVKGEPFDMFNPRSLERLV